jgi:hypothetical protein
MARFRVIGAMTMWFCSEYAPSFAGPNRSILVSAAVMRFLRVGEIEDKQWPDHNREYARVQAIVMVDDVPRVALTRHPR